MNLVTEELPSRTAGAQEAPPPPARSQEQDEQPNTQTDQTDELSQVQLPGHGRSISDFAKEVGEIMRPKQVWFVKGHHVVELRRLEFGKHTVSIAFHPLAAIETRSALEAHIVTGNWKTRKGDGVEEFSPQSMSTETAAALLASPQFRGALPRIERILDVPVPFIHEGELVFANRGYDERLNSYCPVDAPEITSMTLNDAKTLLHELQKDFCFANAYSVTLSTARLLTPMCRGLMGWQARPPVWIFEANRPRAGKDYLAGCTSIVYEGRANEDSPLEAEGEETRKRITAALQSGRRLMHFANSKGFIDNAEFEHATTAKCISARALGKNDASADLTLPNEIEFSVSANTGFSFTEDFNLRCRKISLHFSEEDANSRTFTHRDLHGWVKSNRSRIVSALAALIRHWDAQGRPCGSTPFNSFPEWAEVVGGIMEACGLGDPCQSQQSDGLTGDWYTDEMKKLFTLAYQERPDAWINKKAIYDLIQGQPDAELFSKFDLKERSGQTKFGNKLNAFEKRTLSGIQMLMDKTDKSRPKYRFTKQVQDRDKGVVSRFFGLETGRECEPCEPCEPLPQTPTSNSSSYVCNGSSPAVPDVRNVRMVRMAEDSHSGTATVGQGFETEDAGPPPLPELTPNVPSPFAMSSWRGTVATQTSSTNGTFRGATLEEALRFLGRSVSPACPEPQPQPA